MQSSAPVNFASGAQDSASEDLRVRSHSPDYILATRGSDQRAKNKRKRANKRGDQLASFRDPHRPLASRLPVRTPEQLQQSDPFWNRWVTPSGSSRDGIILPSLRDQGIPLHAVNPFDLEREHELVSAHRILNAFQADFARNSASTQAVHRAPADPAARQATAERAEDEAHQHLLRSQREVEALLGTP